MSILEAIRDYSDYGDGPLRPVDMSQATVVPVGIQRDPTGVDPKLIREGSAEWNAHQQVRQQYDKVLQVVGATPAKPQEDCRDLNDYKRQLLTCIAPHTANYKNLPCRFLPDEKLAEHEANILADAMRKPFREGKLAEIKTTDPAGRQISEFVGPKSTWFSQFKAPIMATGIVIDGVPRKVL